MTQPPDAFLSYARFDDQHDGGAISEFRLRLANAVRAATGKPFQIFQDVDGIGLGEKWADKLDQILDEARFFVPIITPSYFTSSACRGELEKFLRAEADRGRADLVLPIYCMECDLLEDPALRAEDLLATAIHERQRQDWRELRYEPFDAPDVRRALDRLARDVVRARHRVTSQIPASTGHEAQPTPPRPTSLPEPGRTVAEYPAEQETWLQASDLSGAAGMSVMQKVEAMMPELFKEMRADIKQNPLQREFVLLSRKWSYNADPNNQILVYYFEEHEHLRQKNKDLGEQPPRQ
jgi:F-box protein 11